MAILCLANAVEKPKEIPMDPNSQNEQFKGLAHELEADEVEARWGEQLKKVAAHRLPPKQEQPQ